MTFRRVIWTVLDSVGIGEMPDAAKYGDAGSDTLGNIARQRRLHLPNFCELGLANIKPLTGLTHDHGTLGDGRHSSRKSFPAVPARFSAPGYGRIRAENRPPRHRQ